MNNVVLVVVPTVVDVVDVAVVLRMIGLNATYNYKDTNLSAVKVARTTKDVGVKLPVNVPDPETLLL